MITQKFSYDCAVCSTAMFLNKPYEEVAKALELTKEGIGNDKIAKYLWDNEIDVLWFEGFPPKKGTPAIVSVWSKNFEGKWHSIYFDGEKVFDPARSKPRYETYEEVKKHIIGSLQVETSID